MDMGGTNPSYNWYRTVRHRDQDVYWFMCIVFPVIYIGGRKRDGQVR